MLMDQPTEMPTGETMQAMVETRLREQLPRGANLTLVYAIGTVSEKPHYRLDRRVRLLDLDAAARGRSAWLASTRANLHARGGGTPGIDTVPRVFPQ